MNGLMRVHAIAGRVTRMQKYELKLDVADRREVQPMSDVTKS